jgi:uncharacterized protein (DUF1501 family)
MKMDPVLEHRLQINRRYFFGRTSTGIGGIALASLLNDEVGAEEPSLRNAIRGLRQLPHHKPKVNRVIYLFQSGGPTQLDLYDPKPQLAKFFGQEVPKSVYPDERKTTMTSGQDSFPTAPSVFRFRASGDCGTELSEVLPYTSQIADDLCVVRSMYTEAINHDPAITFFQSGSVIPGRPSMGAWLSYGLGSLNHNLPAFVAMTSAGSAKSGQPLYDRLWGSGFMPSQYQGVNFRRVGDPVLDIANPPGVSREMRNQMLEYLNQLNEKRFAEIGSPEVTGRIAQYELAHRLQTSIPELTNFSGESEATLKMYGPDVTKQGTYAYNCLMARRLAERGVRFIQLFHQGWDQHNNLPKQLPKQCKDTDQPSTALIRDLKQRGLLNDTLIVWGGEFGRTVYSQGGLKENVYGRDHHPNCMSIWLAGGGIRAGTVYGETDDYSVNVVRDGVHVHDLHATMLQLLGIDHTKLTYKHQGRYYRLTDVHGKVVPGILA